MNEKIEPALSEDRWAKLRASKNHGQFAVITLEGGNDHEIGAIAAAVADSIEAEDLGRVNDEAKRGAAAIAALNDALPDNHLRKITRAWVNDLRTAQAQARMALKYDCQNWVDNAPCADCSVAYDRFRERLEAMARAFLSYLPPES